MNIQVYCKDGIYSSVISSRYSCVWCIHKREVEKLVQQVLWDVKQCCVLDTYSSFRWTLSPSSRRSTQQVLLKLQFSYLAVTTRSCSCLVWIIDGRGLHMTVLSNWPARWNHSVTCGGEWMVVLPCLAIKKLLKSRKRYVQNIKLRQGLMSLGFLIWCGSICVKY